MGRDHGAWDNQHWCPLCRLRLSASATIAQPLVGYVARLGLAVARLGLAALAYARLSVMAPLWWQSWIIRYRLYSGMTSPVPTDLTPSPRTMPWLPLTEERHVVITKWCVVPWQLPGAIAPVQVAIVDGWCNRHRLVTSVVHDDETPACSGSRISLMCESPFGVYSGADWLRDDIGDSRGLP